MCALNVCRHEGHYEPRSLSTQAYPIAFPLSGPMQEGRWTGGVTKVEKSASSWVKVMFYQQRTRLLL